MSVVDTASAGVAHASEPLPFLERIQRSFGRHQIGHSRAAIDGASDVATQHLGAHAFTIGSRIGFRSTPDLRLAAHEAAHVVQQESGVALDSELGARGDRFELNADAAAEAVVRGQSAEPILDRIVNGDGKSSCGCGACSICGARSPDASVQLQEADEEEEEEEVGSALRPFSSYTYGITEQQMCGGQKCMTDEEIYQFAAPHDPTLAKRASSMGVLQRWEKCRSNDCDGDTFNDGFYNGVQSGWFYSDEKEELENALGRTARRKARAKQAKVDAEIAKEQAWEAQGEEMINFANSPGLLGWYACEAYGEDFNTSMKCGEYVNAAATVVTIAKGGHSFLKNRRGPIASEGPNGFVIEDFEGPTPRNEARLGSLLGEEGSLERVRTRYGDTGVSKVAELAENKQVARFIQKYGEAGIDALIAAEGDLAAAQVRLPAYQLAAQEEAQAVEQQQAIERQRAQRKVDKDEQLRLRREEHPDWPVVGKKPVKPYITSPSRYAWKYNDGNFIDAKLSNGTLRVTLKALGKPRARGSALLDAAFDHFGPSSIQRFQGQWVRGTGFEDNLNAYLKELGSDYANAEARERAAWKTWTGQEMKRLEFTKVSVPEHGADPNEVDPLFSK
jgi:hypothetical protein